MLREKTSGGLLVVPNIYFMEHEEVPGYKTPEERAEVSDDDEPIEDIDPFKGYKSSLFDRPTLISFEFFDPQKDIAVSPVLAAAGQNRPKVTRKPTNTFVNFDGTEPEVEWDEGEVIGMSTEMNAQLGYNFVPDQHHYDATVETEMDDEEMGRLFTELSRKAGENLVSGKVKREDIVQFAARDNSIYKGSELTEFDYMTDYHEGRAAEILKDVLPNAIAEQLEGIANGNGNQFKDVLPAIEKPMKEAYGKGVQIESSYKPYALQHVTGNTLLSTIIHGIGEKDFLSTFLDTFKSIRPKAVDEFLGSSRKLDDNLAGMISRALPVGSVYHNQLVKNHYKNGC
jgi:hypothetical protein